MSSATITELNALVSAVLAADTNAGSHLHGEAHWKCVAWTGLQLVDRVEGADTAVVFLFGLFHDAQRLDDGHDRDHGRRAAELVRRMHGEHFSLDAARLQRLIDACAGHVDGRVHADPTIGLCWDADRLNLWRIGVTPATRYLSTGAAREPDVIAAAKRLEGQHLPWAEIWRTACEKAPAVHSDRRSL